LSNKFKLVLITTLISNFFMTGVYGIQYIKAQANEGVQEFTSKAILVAEVKTEDLANTVVIGSTQPAELPAPIPLPEPPKPVVIAQPAKVAAKPAAPKTASVARPNQGSIAKGILTCANTDNYYARRVCEEFGAQGNNALIIAYYESHYNNGALSPTNDYGFFQINCPSHRAKVGGDCTKLYDFETNLRIAKQVYGGRGNWSAWYTSHRLR
jgi:hypothetical protein